jgi:hypothetical protein
VKSLRHRRTRSSHAGWGRRLFGVRLAVGEKGSDGRFWVILALFCAEEWERASF